jgi:hypothetical protein
MIPSGLVHLRTLLKPGRWVWPCPHQEPAARKNEATLPVHRRIVPHVAFSRYTTHTRRPATIATSDRACGCTTSARARGRKEWHVAMDSERAGRGGQWARKEISGLDRVERAWMDHHWPHRRRCRGAAGRSWKRRRRAE